MAKCARGLPRDRESELGRRIADPATPASERAGRRRAGDGQLRPGGGGRVRAAAATAGHRGRQPARRRGDGPALRRAAVRPGPRPVRGGRGVGDRPARRRPRGVAAGRPGAVRRAPLLAGPGRGGREARFDPEAPAEDDPAAVDERADERACLAARLTELPPDERYALAARFGLAGASRGLRAAAVERHRAAATVQEWATRGLPRCGPPRGVKDHYCGTPR